MHIYDMIVMLLLPIVWSDELLVEFFEYYTNFNFAEHGISVVTGSLVEKPDPSVPVYIENPLERELNVSKNILESHLQNFQTQCEVARDTLKRSSMVPRSRKIGDLWGLLSILKTDDQLMLSEDLVQSQTASDEDVNRMSAMSEDSGVVDVDDDVGQAPQPTSLGVVDIHEILRDDNDVDDTVADNVSNRTL